MRPPLERSREIVAGAGAACSREKIGARDSRRALTFAQWNERACRLANALLGLGLQQGDRVALLAYNCVEWLEIYVALAKAGLVAVPINFRLVGAGDRYIVDALRGAAFIVQDELLERVEAIRDELAYRRRTRTFTSATSARPPGWTVVRGADRQRRRPASRTSHVEPDDTWALMYTSGTTGRPKGAIRNHAGSALISLVTALDMGFTRDDTALLVMPMCHANSLYFASRSPTSARPCVVDDRKQFDPEALLAHDRRAAHHVHVARADALHHDARACRPRSRRATT